MFRNLNLAKAIVIVFLASACTMVIELVAGRILAPYIGVSLYTWTSIIGVVLAGISLGNFLGGKLGDKYSSPLLLSILLFAACLLSLAILPATLLLKDSPLPNSVHLMGRATLYTFILFFLPTTVLGMITPIVIKRTLKDLGKTANVVGTIYAISCVGSILGTFLTGFFLISWFGTRLIVWEVSGTLFVMALLSSGLWKNRVKLSLIAAVIIMFAVTFHYRDTFQTQYVRESNYYAINTYDTYVEGKYVKALSLDHLVHSFVDVNDPTFHGYGYEKTFAGVAKYIAESNSDMKVVLIGGGGYSFSRYLEAVYPLSSVEVVEIDPAVTEVAYSHLGLSADSRIVTHNLDARIFFSERKSENKYGLVIGDAFNDMSVPYHLTTLEFNESIKRNLNADGFYIVNLIDNLGEGRFVRSFMKTLERTFRHVYLFQSGRTIVSGSGTYVVMAIDGDFDSSKLVSIFQASEKEFGSGALMTLEDVERNLDISDSVVLSDDYVPVDNMIAPLFATGR